MDAFSERRVTSVWTELSPGGYRVTEPPDCLDTWCHPVRVNFLLLHIPPALLFVRACEKEVERTVLVGVHFVLMLVSKGGS